jgi:probable HAF family extracellular repeat protein
MMQGNRSFVGAVFAVVAIVGAVAARGDGFTTIDVPGARDTKLWGINSNGDVVGSYTDDVSPFHGFLQTSDGSIQTIDVPFPEAIWTAARAINDNGDIVGLYGLADGNQRGWLLHDGAFTVIAVPGATSTFGAVGINNLGTIVGSYNVGAVSHGFVLTGTCFTTIDVPDAVQTFVRGINDAGDLVGRYDTADHILHGFLQTADGRFQTLDFPTATIETVAGAINARGEIVGRTTTATGTHGFLFKDGRFRQIDFPGATRTEAAGIVDDIVGSYDFGGPPPPVQQGFKGRE